MIRLFARHTGRHVPRPPAGHIGPHVDASEVGTISWPREVRLAIEAPKPEPEPERPSWRHRLAARFADAVALITGLGVFEAETRAAGLPGSCDWGGCDEPATGERWDDDDGWLPVCAGHASDDDEGDEGGDYDPGICPHCGHPGFDGGVCGRCGAHPGPGYFHHDRPAEYVPAVKTSEGEYVGLKGTIQADDDTLADLTAYPHAGPPAWRQNRWPMPEPERLQPWIQEILGAPSVAVYIWNMSQRCALAAA